MYMTCEICGNEFETKSVNALYCKECKVRKIPQEERVCAVCGKVFSCNISATNKACSKECNTLRIAAWRRDYTKKYNKIHKEKIYSRAKELRKYRRYTFFQERKICKTCGKFFTDSNKTVNCPGCIEDRKAKKAITPKEKICIICGATFMRLGNVKCCSPLCRAKNLLRLLDEGRERRKRK